MQMLISIKNNRDNRPIFQKTTANKKTTAKNIAKQQKTSRQNLIALKGYCITIAYEINMVITRSQKEKRVIELYEQAQNS